MNVRDNLIAARALIEKEENWEQGYSGAPDKACAIIAISRVGAITEVMLELYKYTPISISIFNDTHTHAEVLALFDLAIAGLG